VRLPGGRAAVSIGGAAVCGRSASAAWMRVTRPPWRTAYAGARRRCLAPRSGTLPGLLLTSHARQDLLLHSPGCRVGVSRHNPNKAACAWRCGRGAAGGGHPAVQRRHVRRGVQRAPAHAARAHARGHRARAARSRHYRRAPPSVPAGWNVCFDNSRARRAALCYHLTYHV